MRQLIFILFFTNTVFGQSSDYQINFNVGINNYNISGYEEFAVHFENEKGLLFGGGITRFFSNKSMLTANLELSTLSYTGKFNNLIGFTYPDPSLPIVTTVNAVYLQIPISFGYNFINQDSSKFKLFTSAGLNPHIAVKRSELTTFQDLNQGESNFLRAFKLILFAEIGVGYYFSSTLSANIKIVYYQNINGYGAFMKNLQPNIPIVFSVGYKI